MGPVFVLADQRRRWELNDLAERLDSQPAAVEPSESLVPAPARSASGLSPDGYRMLPAIDELPEDSGRRRRRPGCNTRTSYRSMTSATWTAGRTSRWRNSSQGRLVKRRIQLNYGRRVGAIGRTRQ